MKLYFPPTINKNSVFDKVETFLSDHKLRIIKKDTQRPWGGFFVIDEAQSELFIKEFFGVLNQADLLLSNKLSPKILIVEPGKRLSWQYHFRRAELWTIISGEVGIVISETDEENEIKKYDTGSVIKLKKEQRHRLIGLDGWGIVAEIWQHTDSDNPSDEEDIIRLQDDYGR